MTNIMRPICWIQVSDIHIRASDAWSQDVVLKALCDYVTQQCAEGVVADFILVTGDLAYSGKADEYTLAADFFDALCAASGVPKERAFCIPGNHDIDRDRQNLCFLGARTLLQNQTRIDALLAVGEDLQTLLKRQENYRRFQNLYFTGQNRSRTADGLAYVSRLTIDDVRLAVIGLDSAWLAEGGVGDHGKLLIGERQVINAIKLAQECDDPPNIVVAMAHHPLHLLQEFDRLPTQNRIEKACHFFHCGHLHEPETRTAGYSGAGCLTLAAGASFQTRQSHNTYSVVTLDLLRAVRTVKIIQYNPGDGAFSFASSAEYPIEVMPADTCSVSGLAHAMKRYNAVLSPWAHYLSALLLDRKAELPIPGPNGHTFGSFGVMEAQPDGELKRKTAAFMAFRNVLRVLYKRVPLPDIFERHGAAVGNYGAALDDLCSAQSGLGARLAQCESDAQMLASAEPPESFCHTRALLDELAAAQEWGFLCAQAQRHVDSPHLTVAVHAKRMLALGLAHSDEAADKQAAIELYRSLAQGDSAEVGDAGNLATLLMETGKFEEAKTEVLGGIEKYPANRTGYLFEIGHKIAEATGDREFRKQIEATIARRGRRD